jgi:predicted small lipoprotein YifL
LLFSPFKQVRRPGVIAACTPYGRKRVPQGGIALLSTGEDRAMKTCALRIVATALALCFVLAGCGQKSPGEQGQAAQATDHAAKPAPAAQSETTPAPASGEGAAAGEVQLAGTLGCGHCAYHVTPECAAVVKTASGDFYVLDGVGESSELWEKRLEGTRQISVTGTVMGTDKVKHLAMTSFDLK